jgi:hypothetical protein
MIAQQGYPADTLQSRLLFAFAANNQEVPKGGA